MLAGVGVTVRTVDTDPTVEAQLLAQAERQARATENIAMTNQWIFWAVVVLTAVTAIGFFGR